MVTGSLVPKVDTIAFDYADADGSAGLPRAASWGRYPVVRQERRVLSDATAKLPVSPTDYRTMLPYGNGRSYGDSCLNDGGVVLDCRGLDRIIDFDPDSGLLRCEAGVLLGDIAMLTLPLGWFLPVTPGTRFVTVGGAIANDVHGKNHHVAGTFGAHVTRFELMRSSGRRIVCSATENAEWRRATIGGMGLTGIITWAEIQLRRVDGARLDQTTTKLRDLDHCFSLFDEADRRFEYTVAWLDSTASGDQIGRGTLIAANHAADSTDRTPPPRQPRLAIPFQPPIPLVNRVLLGLYNRTCLALRRRPVDERQVDFLKFFYPLDGIGRWNRLYGPRGLLQHQSVLPGETARDAVREMLRLSQARGAASLVTVLKRFGGAPRQGILSFPREGFTLTLDFANRGARTFKLLEEIDGIVIAAGGRVNPYKDARMSPETFEASFPDWQALLPFKDPRFSSSFWRRVTGGSGIEA